MRFSEMLGFDRRRRVHVRVGNWYDEGSEEPVTKCLNGIEEWIFDPPSGRVSRESSPRGNDPSTKAPRREINSK
ncbi:MAG TPA: hypothetical protein VJN43_17590 [Bryobacteraceae bacterium]|nr:hypothetical protein [Bryobacteraceae bacterium]